jgi:O-antigen/teichoic acid export membrane protein
VSTGFTVARNTIYLSLSTAFALCIALAFNIFLARTLGVERFGAYSFALSFVGLFGVLVEFSLDSVIVRDVARDPTTAGPHFGNALLLKGLLFLLAFMLIVATSAVLGYPSQIRLLLYILSLGLLFDGVTKCCASLFSAAQRMQYPAALFIGERVLFALLGLVAVSLQGSVIAVVMCYVAAQAVTQLASVVLIQRQLGLKPEGIEYRFCKGLSQRASSFFAISMIAAIYADIDKVLLFSMQDQMAVGLPPSSLPCALEACRLTGS